MFRRKDWKKQKQYRILKSQKRDCTANEEIYSFYFAEEVKERKGKKMAKGKKFDAAEKHFEKQRIEQRQRVRELEVQLQKEVTKTYQLAKTVQGLKKENEQLKQVNQQLMELKDLTPEQLDQLKENSRLAETLNVFLRQCGGVYDNV